MRGLTVTPAVAVAAHALRGGAAPRTRAWPTWCSGSWRSSWWQRTVGFASWLASPAGHRKGTENVAASPWRVPTSACR